MAPVVLTPHFLLSELRCHDGTAVPSKFLKNAQAICERAEVLRAQVYGPLIVTSGYRTVTWNKKVGGAKGSYHLTASALDLTSRMVSAPRLHGVYLGLIEAGLVPDGGLGLYENWIHIDLGPRRRWYGGEVK